MIFFANGDEGLIKHWLEIAGIKKNLEVFKYTSKHLALSVCHKNAHILGHNAYKIYKEDAFSYYTDWCSSGYIHGVMDAYLNENAFNIDEIKKICESQQTLLEKGECIHGVGHGLLSYNGYDLLKALDDCKKMDLSNLFFSACVDGVFMENIIASKEVSNSIHPTTWVNNDPLFPCSIVDQSNIVQGACFTNQVARILDLNQNNIQQTAAICSSVNNKNSRIACFYGLGLRFPNLLQTNDIDEMLHACQMIESGKQYCIRGLLKYQVKIIEHDKGQPVQICRKVQGKEAKTDCYRSLGRYLSLRFSNNQIPIKAVCSAAEVQFKDLCLDVKE